MRANFTLRTGLAALLLALLAAAPAWQPAQAQQTIHIVQPGENLYRIGLQHGISWTAIMEANGLTSATIYVGQRLVIPDRSAGAEPAPTEPPPAPPPEPAPAADTQYVVQRGDILSRIALRYGVTMAALAAANNLSNPSLIYAGQVLIIPAAGSAPAPAPPPTGGNKLILVDLSEQRMYVYQDGGLLWTFVVSTGEPGRETRPGSYSVLDKIPVAYGSTWNIWMENWMGIYWAGNLENGIHALPILSNGSRLWAGLLGTRISYGCVVLGVADAQTLFDWAEVGTSVVIQN